jgi:hypothetical protein
MKKTIFIVLLVPVLIFAASLSGRLEQVAYADPGLRGGHSGHLGGGRGGFGGHGGHFRHGGHFGGGIWFDPFWGPWNPLFYPFYPSYYPYYTPPVVVPQQPEEYIQQAPQQGETGYWYYCSDARGYYPHVKSCPGGWMKVVPSPAPADQAPPPDQDQEYQDQED